MSVSCLYYYLGCNVIHVRFHVHFRSTEHTYVNEFDSTTKKSFNYHSAGCGIRNEQASMTLALIFFKHFPQWIFSWRVKQIKSMIRTIHIANLCNTKLEIRVQLWSWVLNMMETKYKTNLNKNFPHNGKCLMFALSRSKCMVTKLIHILNFTRVWIWARKKKYHLPSILILSSQYTLAFDRKSYGILNRTLENIVNSLS